MPMLDPSRDVDHISGVQLLSRFAPFLIVPYSSNADQNLSAALCCMVDMPVVTAARFKSYIKDADLRSRERRKIAPADKILGIRVIGFPDGEDHGFLVRGFCIDSAFLAPYVFCHAEGWPCIRPTRIKSGVRKNFRNLCLCDAIVLGCFQMVFQRVVRDALGHERNHSDEGAISKRELVLPAPDLSEKNIVIELGKLPVSLAWQSGEQASI